MNLFTAAGREQTFENTWIMSGLQSAANMSKAGFFRLPGKDPTNRVFCSYCDLCVTIVWKPEDEPITKHAFYSPRCPFVCQYPTGTDELEELIKVFPSGLLGNCECHPHMDPNMHFFEEAYNNLEDGEFKSSIKVPPKRRATSLER
jgi:hypothetical protein